MRSIKNTHPILKNIQFSKLVKTEGRLREFNFRRSTPEGTILFVIDVTDDRNNRIMFQMQKDNDLWKIQPQLLPDWVVKNEDTFHELIENELKYIS
jgi:hypothetical protein